MDQSSEAPSPHHPGPPLSPQDTRDIPGGIPTLEDLPLPLSPERSLGILHVLIMGILQILVYFLTPRVLFTHVICAGLLWQLYRQGASVREVLPVAVLEEVVTYALWWLIPNSWATILALWFAIYMYETIIGPKISLNHDAVLVSGKDITAPLSILYTVVLYTLV